MIDLSNNLTIGAHGGIPVYTPFAQILSTRVCFTNAGINNNNIYGGEKVLSIYFLLFRRS